MSDQDRLQTRLEEVEATLDAIRQGRVDALVVEGSEGQQVYTLESADLPYRQFLEQMAEGAVSLDAASAILYVNRYFCDLVETPREALLGASFEELIAPSRVLAYRAALRADHPQRLGSALRLASGLTLPVQLAITPVGAGTARRYTVVITDLSERERLQELSAAREAVEAESLAKDRFLAALGHELRGPLNVILGWAAHMLQQPGALSAQALKALGAIERNAKLQQRLIEDMVDVARISSGKLQLQCEHVDLAALSRETASAMQLSAEQRGVSLVVQAQGFVRVVGDAQRLEQILQNLVGNAIKFTPKGGRVDLRVTASQEMACITVQDTGRGIEPKLLALIFQPFRQGLLDNSGKRESGLGLGLAITKQIVELHGGHVTVDSEGEGRGTRFSVELPLADAPAEDPQAGSSDAASPSGTGFQPVLVLSGVRALVVDDQEDIRELTARFLQRAGAEVVSVAGTEAALARLDDQAFDVIVSDLVMPGTDGFELARRVQARHAGKLPVLALSAVAKTVTPERAQASGFAAVLAKPIDEAVLVAEVRALLKR